MDACWMDESCECRWHAMGVLLRRIVAVMIVAEAIHDRASLPPPLARAAARNCGSHSRSRSRSDSKAHAAGSLQVTIPFPIAPLNDKAGQVVSCEWCIARGCINACVGCSGGEGARARGRCAKPFVRVGAGGGLLFAGNC
ncbi:hypothetical protein EVAR_13286_1 [Eumeta japonica]|uniref:Uncharacterized protein n=1 Tax=Eumeta variegata TaxID=151549 RepID=A0A4C1YQJ6_EUMVA|nr:hypothetical protein EVAR_13286_1 [Eumeta japonica]